MTGAVLWLLFVAGYNAARIQILLHPEIDPQGAGYQAVMARRILGASRLMGKGGDLSIQPQTVWGRELLPEMMLPEWNHDFLPTTMVYKLGWLPYLLLLAVLAVLLLWMLRRCACQQSQSGKLLALAVVLTLAVQSAFAAQNRCFFMPTRLCGGAESGLCAVQCPAPSGDGKSPQHGGLRPDRVGAVGLPLRVHFAGRGGSGPAAPANTNSLTRKDKGGEGAPLRPCCMQFVSWPPESGRSGSPPRPRISPLPGPHAPPAPPAAHPS